MEVNEPDGDGERIVVEKEKAESGLGTGGRIEVEMMQGEGLGYATGEEVRDGVGVGGAEQTWGRTLETSVGDPGIGPGTEEGVEERGRRVRRQVGLDVPEGTEGVD